MRTSILYLPKIEVTTRKHAPKSYDIGWTWSLASTRYDWHIGNGSSAFDSIIGGAAAAAAGHGMNLEDQFFSFRGASESINLTVISWLAVA